LHQAKPSAPRSQRKRKNGLQRFKGKEKPTVVSCRLCPNPTTTTTTLSSRLHASHAPTNATNVPSVRTTAPNAALWPTLHATVHPTTTTDANATIRPTNATIRSTTPIPMRVIGL